MGATGRSTLAVEVPGSPPVPLEVGSGGGGALGGGEAKVADADMILNQKICNSLWGDPKVVTLVMNCQLTGNHPICRQKILFSATTQGLALSGATQANKENKQTRRQWGPLELLFCQTTNQPIKQAAKATVAQSLICFSSTL